MLLRNLINIRSKVFLYGSLFIVVSFIILFIYFKINYLNSKIDKLKIKLREKDNIISVYESNEKEIKNSYNSCLSTIENLKREIDNINNLCKISLNKKDELIKKLNKVCLQKPKDIHPKIIEQKKCKFIIETKESLKNEDIIFDVLSNIGK